MSSMRLVLFCTLLIICSLLRAQVGSGPFATASASVIPQPRDHPFKGLIHLAIDATDIRRHIFHVKEIIPLQGEKELTLLYPEWETTSHGPTASAVELAGLQIEVDGKTVEWHRDWANVHAFHLQVSKDAKTLSLTLDYLSPKSAAELRSDMLDIQWQRMLLYPAGWYTRDILVEAQLQMATYLHPFTALTLIEESDGLFEYKAEPLDRLVDAPVYAARYSRQIQLRSVPDRRVRLDLVADTPDELAISESEVASLRTLVSQAEMVFGPPPFRHYDILVSLSDELSPGGGLEHLSEGENNLPSNYFSAPEQQLNNRDLIAHEYVHAWNGRFRQPSSLWSPDFNHSTDPSLLWFYEGQTEFWGRILAARAGARTPQQSLDKLAVDAASVANRTGRAWKTLADSTLDVLYMPGHSVTWRDWQRREDYYSEGVLLWLDVNARLRELSHEKYGIDDFAHIFFATHGHVETISTYTLEDVCTTLHSLAAADWKIFLEQHLLTHKSSDVMEGLARSGWHLTYDSKPTETFLQEEAVAGVINLDTSLGMQLRSDGMVRSVVWDSPAFKVGLSPGIQVVKVDALPFSRTAVLHATSSSASVPIHLTLEEDGLQREVILPYAGALRYPHLERVAGTRDRLTPLIAAR